MENLYKLYHLYLRCPCEASNYGGKRFALSFSVRSTSRLCLFLEKETFTAKGHDEVFLLRATDLPTIVVKSSTDQWEDHTNTRSLRERVFSARASFSILAAWKK